MENRKFVATKKLSFMEAVKNVLGNLTNFSGRARRSEYWWYVLASAIVSGIVNVVFGGMPAVSTIIYVIISLLSFAVTVRRVQDSGKSAVWVYLDIIAGIVLLIYMFTSGYYETANSVNPNPKELIAIMGNPIFYVSALISTVCGFVVFIFCLFDSDKDTNKYGESPKYIAVEKDEE